MGQPPQNRLRGGRVGWSLLGGGLDGQRPPRLVRRGQALWRLTRARVRAGPRGWLRRPPTMAERRQIEVDVHRAARISNAYFILLMCSCGIAALGLLQSSAAVVIGAMLISPLMAPIIAMGLALATLQPLKFERASVALAAGAVASVLTSAAIVWLSPLKEVTPEILARTRPTLLDLAVAALSGVVGVYVTITRRGAVIAGVAIATALMPPLAVTGYGLATGAWRIAGGSFLLFLTNVVAILGAVFAVARGYGFKPRKGRQARWEEVALVVTILVLATPLGFSLRSIVVEARETHRARSAIEDIFKGVSPQVTNLSVKLSKDRISQVRAVVITRRFVRDASKSISAKLGGAPVVQVEQILTADAEQAAGGGALANRALVQVQRASPPDPATRLSDLLRDVGTVSGVEESDGVLRAVIRLNQERGLADYQDLETATQRFFPGLRIRLSPPYRDLPPLRFERGSSTLDADNDRLVQAMAWALRRWGYDSAVVTGEASPGRRGAAPGDHALALARAGAVAVRLEMLGLKSVVRRETVPDKAADDPSQDWIASVQPARVPAPAAAGAPAASSAPPASSAPS